MKPQYWIGILALAGSVAGVIVGLLFSVDGSRAAVTGTLIGIAAGTILFTVKRNK